MKRFLTLLVSSLVVILTLFSVHSGQVLAAGGTNSPTNPGTVVIRNEDGTLYLTTETLDTADPRYATISGTEGDSLMDRVIVLPEGFFADFPTLFNRLLTLVIAISALLVFLYLIWGGIDWITSGGDKGKTEQARQKIVAAVIGLIIVAASYAILTLVLNFLGYTSLTDVFNDTRTPVIIEPAPTPTLTPTPSPTPAPEG